MANIDYTTRDPITWDNDKITMGEYPGVRNANKFAYRDILNVADGSAYLTSDGVTNTFPLLTTPTTLTVTYNNTLDGPATNGAFAILIDYVDDDFLQKTAVVPFLGSGTEVTAFTCLGVNTTTVVAAGSAYTNVDDITITAVSDATVQSFVQAGQSLSGQSAIHVPANETIIVKYILFKSIKPVNGQSPRVKWQYYIHDRNLGTTFVPASTFIDTNLGTDYQQVDPVGFAVGPNSTIWLENTTTVDGTILSYGVSSTYYRQP
jgi:hypothetical protein